MTPVPAMGPPWPRACQHGLTKACFKEHPQWARKMFAYRLLCLFLDCTRTDVLQRLQKDLLEPPQPPEDPEPVPSPPLPAPPAEPPIPPPYIEPWQPGPSGAADMIWPPDYYQRVSAEASDGYIMNWGHPLLDVRDGVVGKEIYTGLSSSMWAICTRCLDSGIYRIYRSWFAFDLTGLPSGSIKGAWLTFYRSGSGYGRACVQEGTQADVMTLDDFDAFEDPLFSMAQWSGSPVSLPLNQLGLNYVRSKRAGVAKFCLREYDHDYLCVEFARGLWWNCALYYSEFFTKAYTPRLVLDI